MIAAAESDEPPRRLLLGSTPYGEVQRGDGGAPRRIAAQREHAPRALRATRPPPRRAAVASRPDGSLQSVKCCGMDDTCPVCKTAEIVCGKWTLLLIRDLSEGRSRFCELERSLQGISPRTLSLRLRALEEEGIVERDTYPEVPPRVEYVLTEKGRALLPIIDDMRKYGEPLARRGLCRPRARRRGGRRRRRLTRPRAARHAARAGARARRARARCAAPPSAMIGRSSANQLSAETASAGPSATSVPEHRVQRQQAVAAQEQRARGRARGRSRRRSCPCPRARGCRARGRAARPRPRAMISAKPTADGRSRDDREQRASRRCPAAGTAALTIASASDERAGRRRSSRGAPRAAGLRPCSASAASMPEREVRQHRGERLRERQAEAAAGDRPVPQRSRARAARAGSSACARRRGRQPASPASRSPAAARRSSPRRRATTSAG